MIRQISALLELGELRANLEVRYLREIAGAVCKAADQLLHSRKLRVSRVLSESRLLLHLGLAVGHVGDTRLQ
jgi:hypothetical protein